MAFSGATQRLLRLPGNSASMTVSRKLNSEQRTCGRRGPPYGTCAFRSAAGENLAAFRKKTAARDTSRGMRSTERRATDSGAENNQNQPQAGRSRRGAARGLTAALAAERNLPGTPQRTDNIVVPIPPTTTRIIAAKC